VNNEKTATIPKELENNISRQLEKLGTDLGDIRRISDSILRLSDFYIARPSEATPWQETWAQIAYLSYFLPLNYLRARSVTQEGDRLGFFNNLESLIDFGSGLGSGSLDLSHINNKLFIEKSKIAQELHRSFLASADNHTWSCELDRRMPANNLTVFSYSLTELKSLPHWALDSEALMILEPATRDDGRKLLELRDQLRQKGFHIWAPCTHQGPCPLLTQSKTDWCHDRIHYQQPEWFRKIEARLPMKNTTLTMSYLLARKSPPSDQVLGKVRTVGDQMIEKGKTRQMICRGPDREFLTWMDRDWKNGAPRVPRGILMDAPLNSEKISNELRIKK
jgi:ribosomal protein RSM22 (predicted rRNA methylase)